MVGATVPVSRGSPNQSNSPISHLNLRELGIHWHRSGNLRIPHPDLNSAGEKKIEGESEGTVGWDNARLLGLLGNTVAYDYIYERIDQALDYPVELRDAGIEGKVEARLLFLQSGEWDRRHSIVRSTSRYLRVHVEKTLLKVFADRLPPTYVRRGSLKARCLFEFALTSRNNLSEMAPAVASSTMTFHQSVGAIGTRPPVDEKGSPSSQQGVIGDSLAFFRYGKLFGQWKLGPFSGYGIAPAIGIDIDGISNHAIHLFSGKKGSRLLSAYE